MTENISIGYVLCKCGGKMLPIEMRQIIKDEPFEQLLTVIWKCSDCGKEVKK